MREDFEALPSIKDKLETPGMRMVAREIIALLTATYPWVNVELVLRIDETLQRLMNEVRAYAQDIFVEDPYSNTEHFLNTLFLSFSDEGKDSLAGGDDAGLQDLIYKYKQQIEETNEVLRRHCLVTGLSSEDVIILNGFQELLSPRTDPEIYDWLRRKIGSLNKHIDHENDEGVKTAFRELREKCENSLQRLRKKDKPGT